MKTVHGGRIRTQEEVDPHAAQPLPQVLEPNLAREGRRMITVIVIALVVIMLAAGFVLNRDETRLRP